MDQWELTIMPVIVLMITLALQDWSPGGGELIAILIVALILFGANRLPDLAKGMDESIRNFKAGMPLKQRRQNNDSHPSWFLALALLAVALILSILSLGAFSDEQKLVLTIVLLGWFGVGYWSFGRMGDDQ